MDDAKATKKEKTNKQKGDDGEKFSESVIQTIHYVTEIHPRTYKPVYLPNGKKIMVSYLELYLFYHNSIKSVKVFINCLIGLEKIKKVSIHHYLVQDPMFLFNLT